MTAVTGAGSGTGSSETAPGRDVLALPADIKASIRILIVDDERTLRESCASVLRGEGYSVTLAGRGEEALDLVRRRQFDLVLVDLFISQVPGLEILNAALEANRDCLVVVMTGNPSVTSSIEALRMGAWDYLPKPFSATHLQVLIGRASHAILKGREAADLRLQVMRQHSHSDNLALIDIKTYVIDHTPPAVSLLQMRRGKRVRLADRTVAVGRYGWRWDICRHVRLDSNYS